jgi:GxxExxY protein
MEVHNTLGHGFMEVVYKDALEVVFEQENVFYERQKEYPVYFRDVLLPHRFYADFVVYGKIILVVKCVKQLSEEHQAEAINYLRVSGLRLALVVNFARGKLDHMRLVY